MNTETSIHQPHLDNIDFFRILFTIIILYGHCLKQLILIAGSQAPFFWVKSFTSAFAYMCDTFFIISVFFIFFSFHKKEYNLFKIVINKIARLWPVVICSIICLLVLDIFGVEYFNKTSWCFEMFLLHDALTHKMSAGHMWYVNVMFWGYILYYLIYNIFDKNKISYVIGIIVFCAYSILLKENGNQIEGYIFSFRMVRGIAGMGLGYLIAYLYRNCYPCIVKINDKKATIIWTVIEIISLFLIIKITLVKGVSISFAIIIVSFLMMFYSFLFNKGFLSKLFNVSWMSSFGKYCYSIYMMQYFPFFILKKYLWTREFVINYPLFNIILFVCICTIVGIITYHVVERPCKKLILKYAAKACD